MIFIINILSHFSAILQGRVEFNAIYLLLSIGLILNIFLIIPMIIYSILSCAGSVVSKLQIFSTYGYSFAIFIPALALCIIDYEIVRWGFCIFAGICG